LKSASYPIEFFGICVGLTACSPLLPSNALIPISHTGGYDPRLEDNMMTRVSLIDRAKNLLIILHHSHTLHLHNCHPTFQRHCHHPRYRTHSLHPQLHPLPTLYAPPLLPRTSLHPRKRALWYRACGRHVLWPPCPRLRLGRAYGEHHRHGGLV
jgi:hypothetical protein